MLVLTRKIGESVRIGDDIRVRVVSLPGGQVRLAIEAPPEISIYREEVLLRIAQENQMAARTVADTETHEPPVRRMEDRP